MGKRKKIKPVDLDWENSPEKKEVDDVIRMIEKNEKKELLKVFA